ncbi:hypothetical protein [Krasilnikoviella flava]|uniref:Uncharacterized protein n=1 Tax=Krasilnikoviella flava TaxID=526729 RepID=A0A1T5LYV7_9MICO|nr:hypothetical protein [Krasilnikoviella flava]SKC81142.1 hypothetical protein SAMN04324258_4169 [Krasilnikoviella flava]
MPVVTMPPPSAPDPALPAARFTPPDLVDLRTAWTRERELAGAPRSRHDAGGLGRECPGRHGWLLDDGLDVLLEPALGGSATPGYYPFAALDERTAAGLLERLDEDRLATERQNLGPTLGTVLRAVVRHPDRVRAQGYVVGPLRCDERISVTGVLLRADRALQVDRRHGPACECADVVRALADLGVDDMHAPPDEVTPWWGGCPPDGSLGDQAGESWFRVWWD